MMIWAYFLCIVIVLFLLVFVKLHMYDPIKIENERFVAQNGRCKCCKCGWIDCQTCELNSELCCGKSSPFSYTRFSFDPETLYTPTSSHIDNFA